MTTTEFAELAKLCRDPNLLGSNLLSMAKTLSDHSTPNSKQTQCCMCADQYRYLYVPLYVFLALDICMALHLKFMILFKYYVLNISTVLYIFNIFITQKMIYPSKWSF